MNQLHLFLPCAAGVEGFLADEVHRLTGLAGDDLLTGRGGVMLRASWRDAMLLNLHSRLAQRVLVQLSHTPYRSENDLYEAAAGVASAMLAPATSGETSSPLISFSAAPPLQLIDQLDKMEPPSTSSTSALPDIGLARALPARTVTWCSSPIARRTVDRGAT